MKDPMPPLKPLIKQPLKAVYVCLCGKKHYHLSVIYCEKEKCSDYEKK